jgi:hypothetical protein
MTLIMAAVCIVAAFLGALVYALVSRSRASEFAFFLAVLVILVAYTLGPALWPAG